MLERLDHLRSTQEELSYSSDASGGTGGCATRLSSVVLVSFDRKLERDGATQSARGSQAEPLSFLRMNARERDRAAVVTAPR
ncbi:hypothetical protein JCGZ_25700 [Jatropha curcas]|uniref:Uncharacterized protein n=1 Tax=Jatropha curcas TaxID=180498 RepID=A0A067JYX7_JATCU|nr:hypothetical protein JCGZ_25700 [Jatropha curcas]